MPKLSITADDYAQLRKSGLSQDQIVQKYTATNTGPSGLLGIDTGIVKGALSTVKGAATLGEKIANQTAGRVVNAIQGNGFKPLSSAQLGNNDIANPDSTTAQGADAALAPKNTAQNIGFYGEKVGEFFVPGLGEESAPMKVAAAPSIIPDSFKALTSVAGKFASSAGKEAIGSGAVTAVQTGGDSTQVGENAGLSAAFGGAGEATDKLLSTPIAKNAISYLTEKVPATMINRILHPSIKDFSFGKNPGLGVLNEPGLLGTVKGPVTRGGLLASITASKQAVGQQIGDELTKVGGTTLDLAEAVTKPVDDALAAATRSGEQTLVDRLTGLRQSLTKEFKLVGDKIVPIADRSLQVSPKDAQALKIEVGQNTRWTGQAFDNDINKVRVQVYRNIDQAIDKAAPATEDLNSRYANLLTAEKALERRNAGMQSLVGLGLRQTGIGGIVGLGSYLKGESPSQAALTGFAGAVATKALGSTAAQTRIASALNKLGPAERESMFRIAPALRNAYLGIRTTNRQNSSRVQTPLQAPQQ